MIPYGMHIQPPPCTPPPTPAQPGPGAPGDWLTDISPQAPPSHHWRPQANSSADAVTRDGGILRLACCLSHPWPGATTLAEADAAVPAFTAHRRDPTTTTKTTTSLLHDPVQLYRRPCIHAAPLSCHPDLQRLLGQPLVLQVEESRHAPTCNPWPPTPLATPSLLEESSGWPIFMSQSKRGARTHAEAAPAALASHRPATAQPRAPPHSPPVLALPAPCAPS
jgi:hypothetical protein